MKIKIVSWNCRDNFSQGKANAIKKLEPEADIFVIQECRGKDMGVEIPGNDAKNQKWYGDGKEATNKLGEVNKNKNRGIGIFWGDKIIVSEPLLPEFNHNYRYVVPYKVTKDKKSFILFAVWTKAFPFYYDANVTKAVCSDEYKDLFNGDVVMIGDFNTFAKKEKFERLVRLEKTMEKVSMINCAKNSDFCKISTYYDVMGRDGIDDFCFVSGELNKRNEENGNKIQFKVHHEDWDNKHRWNGLSDHCPISVKFEL